MASKRESGRQGVLEGGQWLHREQYRGDEYGVASVATGWPLFQPSNSCSCLNSQARCPWSWLAGANIVIDPCIVIDRLNFGDCAARRDCFSNQSSTLTTSHKQALWFSRDHHGRPEKNKKWPSEATRRGPPAACRCDNDRCITTMRPAITFKQGLRNSGHTRRQASSGGRI